MGYVKTDGKSRHALVGKATLTHANLNSPLTCRADQHAPR